MEESYILQYKVDKDDNWHNWLTHRGEDDEYPYYLKEMCLKTLAFFSASKTHRLVGGYNNNGDSIEIYPVEWRMRIKRKIITYHPVE